MKARQQTSVRLNRRNFLSAASLGAASALISSCTTAPIGRDSATTVARSPLGRDRESKSYASAYAAVVDEGYEVPAIPVSKIDKRYLRQVVPDPTGERPGTIVVDTAEHFLYLVRNDGNAVRYGVGLGRAGFEWSGRAVVQWKRKWPKWTPPATMISREPHLAKYSAANGGMPPGLNNPLGARALYIFLNGVDTLYRLHGTPEWQSIGKSVSSGCVRMMNQDVMDLYNRVPNRTPILVV